MTKIISIKPTEDYFSLNWQIDIRCNYDCMYCSPKWHDNSSRVKSMEELQNVWLNVFDKTKNLNLPFNISFTGGELTAIKNFLPFVTWLRDNYAIPKGVVHIKEDIISIITAAATTWLPYINIDDITIITNEDDPLMDHKLSISITISTNTTNTEKLVVFVGENGNISIQ